MYKIVYSSEISTCPICTKDFFPRIYGDGFQTKCCGRKCSAKLAHLTQGNLLKSTKKCPQCNKDFIAKSDTVYCSMDCYRPNMPKGRPAIHKFIKCKQCDQLIKVCPCVSGRKKFCSRTCLAINNLKTKFRRNPTDIEVKVFKALDKLDVDFKDQHRIGKYLADFFIPALGIVIEADGDYWHSRDYAIKNDHIRDQYMINRGYKVFRILGSTIHSMSIEQLSDHLLKLLS